MIGRLNERLSGIGVAFAVVMAATLAMPCASFASEGEPSLRDNRLVAVSIMSQVLTYHDSANDLDASFDPDDGTFCIDASRSSSEVQLTKKYVRSLIQGTFGTEDYSGASEIKRLVIIGDAIKAIQGGCFAKVAATDYSGIKVVDLSQSSISAINTQAFLNDSSVESVVLPSDLDVTISETAFSGCEKLISIERPLRGELIFDRQPAGGIKRVVCGSEEHDLEAFCEHGLISVLDNGATVRVGDAVGVKMLHVPVRSAIENLNGVDANAVKKVILEEGITSLTLERDFSGLAGLEEIVFPTSLTTIVARSFEQCTSLKELDLSNTQIESLEYAGNMLDGSGVEVVSLPKTLKIIGESALRCRDTLKVINFAEDSCLETIQDRAFQDSAIEEIVLPDSVKSIGASAFDMCPNLKSVSISKNVEEVADKAFGSDKGMIPGKIIVRDSCGIPEVLKGKGFSDKVEPALEHNFNTYIVVEPEEPESDQGGIVLQHACSICGEADPDVAPVTLDDLLKQTADEAADATRAEYADYSSPEQVEAAKAAAAKAAAAQASKEATAKAAKAAKKLNTLKVKSKTIAAKAKKKTVVNASKAFGTTKAQGKVTYKVLAKDPKAKSKIAVAKKTGKVTVKKGLKKGTYKLIVQVNAAGNSKYYAGSKVVTLKVKVK